MSIDYDKKVELHKLMAQKQKNASFRAAKAALSGRVTVDDLYIIVSREEYERLIDLAIENLQSRVKEVMPIERK